MQTYQTVQVPPTGTTTDSPELSLARLGLVLPPVLAPAAKYVPVVQVGDVAYTSGQGPINPETRAMVVGKVGATVTVDQAREAACQAGLNALAALKQELGSLDRVARVIKVFGMVNAAPGFTGMPEVLDGCSELLVAVFGDAGRHARSAIGVSELPFDLCLELEVTVLVRPGHPAHLPERRDVAPA